MSLPTPYYQDAAVTIYHGDCREILPVIDASADLILTDPPFGISVKDSMSAGPHGTRNFDFFKNDDPETGPRGLALALAHLRRPGSAFVFLGHKQFGPIETMLAREGMTTKPWAWCKSCSVPSAPGMRFGSAVELAVYGFDAGSWFGEAEAAVRPNYWVGDSYRHGQPGKVAHPTQKPMALISHIVGMLCAPDALILDPFMGSGTTLVAAKEMGRKAIGIEIEERYCAITAERCAQGVLFQ